jgi:hypothetical protein
MRVTPACLPPASLCFACVQVQRYIAEFDTDGDGTIDYAEFIRMLLPSDAKYTIAPAAGATGGDAAAAAGGGGSS